ncbi:MAG: hypothetical protein ALECFALPRED_001441, partial [Alectoria fallacina]
AFPGRQQQQRQQQSPYSRTQPQQIGYDLQQHQLQSPYHQVQSRQTGSGRPQQLERKRQSSYDDTESLETVYGQPCLQSSRALQSSLGHDLQPLHGGMLQPRLQRGQPNLGSSPQRADYRDSCFGQLAGQHQRPNFRIDQRGSDFAGPQPSHQQSRHGSQPLETGRRHQSDPNPGLYGVPPRSATPPNPNPGPHGVRPRRARSAAPPPSSPAGSDVDHMLKDTCSHWTIQDEKTHKDDQQGRRRETNVSLEGASANNAIEIESEKDTTEHVFENLEQSKNRDDPDELGMGSYLYDSPPAEEEPATKQVEANLERENPEAPTSSDDAGPSTSRT